MKIKKIARILAFALCISAMTSMLVSAKEVTKAKSSRSISVCAYDPHPAGGEFPE